MWVLPCQGWTPNHLWNEKGIDQMLAPPDASVEPQPQSLRRLKQGWWRRAMLQSLEFEASPRLLPGYDPG